MCFDITYTERVLKKLRARMPNVLVTAIHDDTFITGAPSDLAAASAALAELAEPLHLKYGAAKRKLLQLPPKHVCGIFDTPDEEEQSGAEHDGNDLFGSPVNSQCADEPEDGATWSDVAGVPNRATGTAYSTKKSTEYQCELCEKGR